MHGIAWLCPIMVARRWIIHHTIDKAASKAAHKAVHARFGKSGKGASDKKGGKSPKEQGTIPEREREREKKKKLSVCRPPPCPSACAGLNMRRPIF